MSAGSALAAGWASCHCCGRLSRCDRGAEDTCARCGARVHPRRRDSIARTWALLLAALILYVPANLLPVMKTRSLLGQQSDTILSGVFFLWQTGSWPLAAVVFVASVFVPLLKLVLLSALVISVQRRSRWRPLERARIYRVLERVGRWSMVDIYVVALLVALVSAGSFAQVEAGPGAAAFGAVVVLTMVAAMSFDPRLIWDSAGLNHAGA